MIYRLVVAEIEAPQPPTPPNDDCRCRECRRDGGNANIKAEHSLRHREFEDWLAARKPMTEFVKPTWAQIGEMWMQEQGRKPGRCRRISCLGKPQHPSGHH